MIWLNPIALLGLLTLAAPVLIHIFARRNARRLPFPTLRFIRPFEPAALRKRALDDAVLLAVRALLLAVAAAAVAGPLLVTPARRRAWDARIIRADVAEDLPGGLHRAVAWLAKQPPGRREIVVRSSFRLGTLGPSDVAAVPAHIGLRFERVGTRATARAIPAAPAAVDGILVDREIVLDGDRTSVRERSVAPAPPLTLELLVPPEQRAQADALLEAARSEGAPVPAADRGARLAFNTPAGMAPIRLPWMADAAARVRRDTGSSPELRFGADAGRLVVATPASVADPAAPALLRAVLSATGPPAEHPEAEILTVPDAQLESWTRPPGPAVMPGAAAMDRDDRRWFWGAALLLLAAESRLRRARQNAAAEGRLQAVMTGGGV